MSEDNAKYPGVFIHESAYVDEPCEIGEGTKIDNLVQIAHNVVIGRHCVIVSGVGIGHASFLPNQR